MALIYETNNFIVESRDQPFVDRSDGGHIRILPKVPVEDRTKLTAELAKEAMKLTMVVGEAMKIALNKRGVDVARVNYQDMGNWTPTFHIHLFGRAKSAKYQKFGESVYLPKRETGFYNNFQPLDQEDIQEIRKEIEKILATEKFRNF